MQHARSAPAPRNPHPWSSPMRLGVCPLRTANIVKSGTAAAIVLVCAGGFFVPRVMAATSRPLVDAGKDVRVDFQLRAIVERADENSARGMTLTATAPLEAPTEAL